MAWHVQRVIHRPPFELPRRRTLITVTGTLSAQWRDVPITPNSPGGLEPRAMPHSVVMRETWARHQKSDGTIGWTLLTAWVKIDIQVGIQARTRGA